ncbi:unnamed protein product [Brachionus calyciflorus]|uniref:Peptidase S1 domain-containing protein n=1 Tax=Brachionus calyciflorus TaxID=104777 RepID=A0A813VC83_9BILA|nr:unnamed protein product [Brachionus calyciflorus]
MRLLKISLILCLIKIYHFETCDYGYNGPDCDECGIQSVWSNPRIIGGSVAKPHSWPSLSLIFFNYKVRVNKPSMILEFQAICGGSLIDFSTVLTAAHCFQKFVYSNQTDKFYEVTPNEFYPSLESMYTVYLGVHVITNIIDKVNLINYNPINVRKIYIHEGYDDFTQENDIALIKFFKKVNKSKNIQLSCLPRKKQDEATGLDLRAVAVGWGVQKFGDTRPSDQLNNVALNIYYSNECDRIYPELIKNWSKQMCAGDVKNIKDTCQGDSGGPLFVLKLINFKMKYVQVGITSYGDGCGKAGHPAIYTRVSAYLDWIDNKLVNY